MCTRSYSTCDLVPLHPMKFVVGCQWTEEVNVGPDVKVDRLKACLVAK